MVVTTTQIWQSLREKVTTKQPLKIIFVTVSSLRDGIVFWEVLEQKCQQRVYHHSDVVQHGQVGWMVLILQWKMAKSKERSALVIVKQVAQAKKIFSWKTVDPSTSTFSMKHHVLGVTVGLIHEGLKSWKKKRNLMWWIYEFLCKHICFFIFV